jgi:hypothetical protein
MKLNRVLVVMTLTVLASMALPVLATGTVAAQQTNTNTTATATPTPTGSSTAGDVCPNPQRPQMSQSRLYAPQQTVTADEPARIDGGFLLESGITCPVKVRVTLRVPSGMTIRGGSDWQSAGAGLVTTTFTLRPGGGIKDVSANVFSIETGEPRVTADFSYFPVGHPELQSEIDGTTMVFDVEEPNPPPEPTPTGSDSSGGSGQPSTPQSTPSTPVNPGPGPIVSFIIAINKSPLFVLGGIAALAIVAIIFVSPKFKIGIRK